MIKILIIRLSSIGDIVLTTPVVRCIRKTLPEAEIHYLTKKEYAPLLRSNPHITKLWLFENNFNLLIPQLQAERFSFIADLHKNFRSLYIRFILRRPSAGFPKLNIKKWMLTKMKIDLLPNKHIVDRYFRAVQKLGVPNDGQGLDYFISPGEEVDPEVLPEAHRNGYFVFVIGGRHNTKMFPPERVAAVCERIPKPVVLLGGTGDRARGTLIAEWVGEKVYNACGLFSINQSASLVNQAEAVITNDTGLMHIAAAYKKPIISIWGNTVPAFGMYPYYPEELSDLGTIIEVKGLHCRPCSKLGYDTCPKGHFDCMNRIDEQEILNAL